MQHQLLTWLKSLYQIDADTITAVTGGGINDSWKVQAGNDIYFLKTNTFSDNTNFQAEKYALKQLKTADSLVTPNVLACDRIEGHNLLLLEYFHLEQSGNWFQMGEQLALLHRDNTESRFGWQHNNFIGSTLQNNQWSSCWASFYAEQRIGYQLERIAIDGTPMGDIYTFVEKVKHHLSGYQPEPSLVHGDLWSGNAGFCHGGTPVIFDPAAYYGSREVDLAMTEIFGGFPEAFYQGYHNTLPLDAGYSSRKPLYHLYHLLNHHNQFHAGSNSSSYLSQALAILDGLLN